MEDHFSGWAFQFFFWSALHFLVMPTRYHKNKNKILNRSLHLIKPSTMGQCLAPPCMNYYSHKALGLGLYLTCTTLFKKKFYYIGRVFHINWYWSLIKYYNYMLRGRRKVCLLVVVRSFPFLRNKCKIYLSFTFDLFMFSFTISFACWFMMSKAHG